MTREEVKEDLQRMKKARVELPSVSPLVPPRVSPLASPVVPPPRLGRSRQMSPEERIRIRGLPSSSAATSEERERVDEEEQGQGETKKARINFLEGRSYIHPAQPHLELAVNDDLEEMRWSEIMNIMMEGGFTDEVLRAGIR